MKKKLLVLTCSLLGGMALILPACSNLGGDIQEVAQEDAGPAPAFEESGQVVNYSTPIRMANDDESFVAAKKVTLHYHNDDGACGNRRFYTWATGVDGVERKPDIVTSTDIQITLDFSEITEYADMPSLFFIIKVAGTWAGQSEDTELSYSEYQPDSNGFLEVWTIPGEGSSIEIYRTEAETQFPKIATAKFSSDWKTIHCVTNTIGKTNETPASYKLYAFDKNYLQGSPDEQAANKAFHLFKEGGKQSSCEFDIKFNYTAKINVQYVIESVFASEPDRIQRVIVSCENLYGTKRFEDYYTYNGDDLGMTFHEDQVTFKIWSPITALATLNIYRQGAPKALGGSDAKRQYEMFYTAGGVWETTIRRDDVDLKGLYYTYSLTHFGGNVEAMDPYAKACGVNGLRAYIYDKDSAEANPDGWDSVPAVWNGKAGYDIATPQDLSIYEIHIRDLTMDETWVSNHDNERGSFKAFYEAGTTYSKNSKTVSTGFDHIKELGVNAIQIIPVFDNDNDERPGKMKFNWGYNPLNYNCVEGGYSSDPSDPLARIKEYKSLIKAYSENGNHTRVIMDVVYNHVSSASSSCFTKSMPKYYFRYDENWNYYDGSGCSNEVKSDATMMRKYIVDSLKWWATEYKIKGFRFDLMALIDTLTLKQAKEAMYAIDPDIYLYGEGWTSGGYHGEYKVMQTDDSEHGNTFIVGSANAGDGNDSLVYSQLYATTKSPGVVGGFNNAGRDNLKGGNDDGFNGNPYPTWGFVSQGSGDVGNKSNEVANLLKGINSWAGANPLQTVSYASCHDNYTLWDQLRYTLAGGYNSSTHVPNNAPATEDVIAASLAAHGVIFAANTASFIQGGEELYRTKSYSYLSKEDLADLMSGGAEAVVRPYPDFVHYSTNPDVIQATSDVRMFNGDIVTHNSYKSPDEVNSFKWDRKIEVDGVDVTKYNEKWCKMIQEHIKMPKVQYPDNLNTPTFNAWNIYDSSTAVALWDGNAAGTSGYYLFVSGRNGAVIDAGDMGSVIYSNGTYSHSNGKLTLSAWTVIVAKK